MATIALERAVPLLVGALAAIGVGFGASAMFVSVQLRHSLVAPDVAYSLISRGRDDAAAARITGPEVARNQRPGGG